MLLQAISFLNNALYGSVLIILLLVGGLYFTFATRFAQLRLLKEQFRCVFEKPKGVSPFQSLALSTASRVGTGNIIGVGSALCLGGFGSVFWMWVIALIGGSTALIESTLAQIYKKRGPIGSYGGPAYYIEQGLKRKPLAIVFSIAMILTYGVGFNMLTSYNLQSTFQGYAFYDERLTPWLIGGIAAISVGCCAAGKGNALLNITGLLVPIMSIGYIAVAVAVMLLNLSYLPDVLQRVFAEAFDPRAIFGGFSGSCVLYGIKRGLFSNEAGVGSAPNAAAAATVSHPVKQGLVQMLSVFIDTLLICSATAFMCMCSGVEPAPSLAGAPYVQASLSAAFGNFGPIFISVAMALFAFTTMLGNLYYIDGCIHYLFPDKAGRRTSLITRFMYCIIIFVGATFSAGLLWNIGDLLMGVMILINVPCLLLLSKYALRALKNYDAQRKNGLSPAFRCADIGIKEKTDYWQ